MENRPAIVRTILNDLPATLRLGLPERPGAIAFDYAINLTRTTLTTGLLYLAEQAGGDSIAAIAVIHFNILQF